MVLYLDVCLSTYFYTFIRFSNSDYIWRSYGDNLLYIIIKREWTYIFLHDYTYVWVVNLYIYYLLSVSFIYSSELIIV